MRPIKRFLLAIIFCNIALFAIAYSLLQTPIGFLKMVMLANILFTSTSLYILLQFLIKPMTKKINMLYSQTRSVDEPSYASGEIEKLDHIDEHIGFLLSEKHLVEQKLKIQSIQSDSEKNIHKLKNNFLVKMSQDIHITLNSIQKMLSSLKRTPLSSDQKKAIQILLYQYQSLFMSLDDYQSISHSFFDQFKLNEQLTETIDLQRNLEHMLKKLHNPKEQKTLSIEYGDMQDRLLCDGHRFIKSVYEIAHYLHYCLSEGKQNIYIRNIPNQSCTMLQCKLSIEGDVHIDDNIIDMVNEYKQNSYMHLVEKIGMNEVQLIFACQILTHKKAEFSIEKTDLGIAMQIQIPLNIISDELKALPQPISLAKIQNRMTCKTPHILIIDNNHINAKIMSIFLEDLGCKVLRIDDTKKGIEAISDNVVDMIFIRLKMPILDGYEAAKIIRKIENQGQDIPYHIPIIAIHDTHDIEQDEFILSGLNEFVVAPLRKADMQKILQQWLEKNHHLLDEKSA